MSAVEERMRTLTRSWRQTADRLAFFNRTADATQYRNFADAVDEALDECTLPSKRRSASSWPAKPLSP